MQSCYNYNVILYFFLVLVCRPARYNSRREQWHSRSSVRHDRSRRCERPPTRSDNNQLCLSIVLLYRHFVVLEGAMELKFAPVLFLLRCPFRWYPFVFLPPAESSSGEPGVVETCPFPTDPETYEERAFCADCICSSCQVVRHMLGFTACHLASYVLFPV